MFKGFKKWGQECKIFNCLHVGGSVTSAVLRSKSDNKRMFSVLKLPDFLKEHRLCMLQSGSNQILAIVWWFIA
jgi:putative ribosome biogenesis GTPase RsgA